MEVDFFMVDLAVMGLDGEVSVVAVWVDSRKQTSF